MSKSGSPYWKYCPETLILQEGGISTSLFNKLQSGMIFKLEINDLSTEIANPPPIIPLYTCSPSRRTETEQIWANESSSADSISTSKV